jgi:hypothetical protein
VVLAFIDGETAQVFHIVDELSYWYPQPHAQYAAWSAKEMPLDDAERALLAKHAKLRAKRGWGGLDQAFEVNAPIEEAVRAAREKKLLSAADAENERALLEHFAPRLTPFLLSQREVIAGFEARLAAALPRVAPMIARLGRFCETSETLSLRAVVVPTAAPVEGEGRVTRASIVLEIAPGDDSVGVFLHHLAHALLLQRRGTIAVGAGKCDEAIDDDTVEEGLAYAFAPGLTRGAGAGADPLRDLTEVDRARSLRDPRVRAERLGLAVRTELSAALEGGHETIGSFLPKVCEAWGNVAKP